VKIPYMKLSLKGNPLLLLSLVVVVLMSAAAMACPEEHNKQADHAYRQAGEFLQARNWVQAIPSLESALNICPEHENSLKWLGKAKIQTKDYAGAQVALEKLIEVRGQGAEAGDYMDLGKTYAKLKDYRKARQAYVNAQKLSPNDCNVLFNLGVMHGAVKDYVRQVDVFEQAYNTCDQYSERILPMLTKACKKAADKERGMGNLADANAYEAKYKEYAENAGGREGYKLISQTMQKGNYAEAVTLCKSFLVNEPEHSSAWLSLARCEEHLGRNADAVTSYKKYLALRPGDYATTGTLLELYAKSERCEEGESAATAAAAKFASGGKEQLAEIYYGWGKILECQSRYMDAKEKFRYVTTCGNAELTGYARQEMERQNQLDEIRQLKRQNAGR
jgi:tetratricopeptide (TPR) repeat protein